MTVVNKEPGHVHTYNEKGEMTCCSQEAKVYRDANASDLLYGKPAHSKDDGHDHDHEHSDDDDHDHSHGTGDGWKVYLPAIISFVLLMTGILLDNYIKPAFFQGIVRFLLYALAYVPVGIPVIIDAIKASAKKEFFTEFTLMAIATIGAFILGEYPEGVAVMLFYAVGELFQSAAVNRAKRNIKALLDVRPDTATVKRDGSFITVAPDSVEIDETIQVKAGEKIPLDGTMLSEGSSFNTAALTGESKPSTIRNGEPVLAGMLNLDKVIEIKVTKKFADSSLARILDMVQNATARKAPTELFIRKFSKIYTPAVALMAVALAFLPYFFVEEYVMRDWVYRALIFLVISCPCALVISIPLGYFGGIGAASRNGILFKGSTYLDLMTKLNTVVMDKTGTLTAGVFKVQDIVAENGDKQEMMRLLAALESKSTHPIAKAIAEYEAGDTQRYEASDITEISGHGLKGMVNGKEVLAGNTRLLKKFGVAYDTAIDSIPYSIVAVGIDGRYAGYVLIADEIKPDAAAAVKGMHDNGITQTVMLSGDKDAIVQQVARTVGIDVAYGDLLPENKVEKVEAIQKDPTRVVAFVGDGINDAPVLALSNVGFAMGGLGSDAAIETADVIIQTDQPSKIPVAIRIGKVTRRIVWQNITLAFVVKAIVLALGAGGLATMWEAVFADVGVSLIAIVNAIRIQRIDFNK